MNNWKTKETTLMKIGMDIVKVDKPLAFMIRHINKVNEWQTVGCCSGHGIYPPTIVVKHPCSKILMEAFTQTIIPRIKRSYLTDSKGRYYIPEVSEPSRR